MKILRATLIALSMALCGGGVAGSAWAASRVAVVRPPRESRIAHEALLRLRAEVEAAGFEVVTIDANLATPPRETVEDESFGSVATLLIVDTEEGAVIDVWVADHLTKKTVVQRIRVESSDEGNAASILAIRTVELLRASLIEVDHRPDIAADVRHFVEQPAPPLNPPVVLPPPLGESDPPRSWPPFRPMNEGGFFNAPFRTPVFTGYAMR